MFRKYVRVINGFRDYVMNHSPYRIFAFLNVSFPGIFGFDKGVSLGEARLREMLPVDRCVAKIEANHAGADDALMLDSSGFVAETNATHLFIVEGGSVMTSRLVARPEGITREVVLGLCRDNDIPHEVRDVSLTEVYRADELFCTGTMGELAPVIQVDGRPIGGGEIGPVTQRLAKLFDACVAAEAEPVLD